MTLENVESAFKRNKHVDQWAAAIHSNVGDWLSCIQVSCTRGVYQVPTDGRNAKDGPGSDATGSGAGAGAADAVGSGAGAGAATAGLDTGVFNGIYLGTFPDTSHV